MRVREIANRDGTVRVEVLRTVYDPEIRRSRAVFVGAVRLDDPRAEDGVLPEGLRDKLTDPEADEVSEAIAARAARWRARHDINAVDAALAGMKDLARRARREGLDPPLQRQLAAILDELCAAVGHWPRRSRQRHPDGPPFSRLSVSSLSEDRLVVTSIAKTGPRSCAVGVRVEGGPNDGRTLTVRVATPAPAGLAAGSTVRFAYLGWYDGTWLAETATPDL